MKQFLVVVDMQKDFVDGALGTPEAVAIVPKVAEKIDNFYGDIFVTYDTHFDDYMQTNEGKYLPVPHCIKGSLGWHLDLKVRMALEGKRYLSVQKMTFGSVELPELIREAAGEEPFTVELIGLCTDIGGVSNALILKANFPQMEIIVDSSCCAGVTPQSHEAALTTMRMCQIQVR